MPIDLIYDISVEETLSEWGKCIHAPEAIFQIVAGLIHKIATEKPDAAMEIWLQRELQIDYDLQAALFAFATQLLGDNLCIEGGDMRLRQRPDNDCILQQDQGGSWVDVFDYSLCMQPLMDLVQQGNDQAVSNEILGTPQQLLDEIADYRDRYEGTSASYDPALTNVDQSTAASICEALRSVVDNAISASKTYKQQESESLDRAAVVIGVGVAVGAVIIALASGGILGPAAAGFMATYFASGSIAAVSTGLALGLTTAGLAAWAQNVKDTAAALFNNTAAVGEIVCYWYTNLRFESDIPLEKFQEAFDLSEASAEAQELWSVIQPLVQQEAYYAAFLKAWKRSVALIGVGVPEDCGCDDVPDTNLVVEGSYGSVAYLGKVGEGLDKYRLTMTAFPGNAGTAGAFSSTGGLYRVHSLTVIDGDWNASFHSTSTGPASYYESMGDTIDETVSETVLYYYIQFQSEDFDTTPFIIDVVVKQPPA